MQPAKGQTGCWGQAFAVALPQEHSLIKSSRCCLFSFTSVLSVSSCSSFRISDLNPQPPIADHVSHSAYFVCFAVSQPSTLNSQPSRPHSRHSNSAHDGPSEAAPGRNPAYHNAAQPSALNPHPFPETSCRLHRAPRTGPVQKERSATATRQVVVGRTAGETRCHRTVLS